MQNKIIYQLQTCFRGYSLEEANTLILQLLAWTRVSLSKSIPEGLRIDVVEESDGLRALDVLNSLHKLPGIYEQAFSLDFAKRIDVGAVANALSLLKSLIASGVMQGFDHLDLRDLDFSSRSGLTPIPTEISVLMSTLANVSDVDDVYVPWDFYGQITSECSSAAHSVYLETPSSLIYPALISLIFDKKYELHQADPVSSPAIIDGKLRKFDVAVSLPPHGMKYGREVVTNDWFSRFPEPTLSGSVLLIRHLLAVTKNRIVVGVPNSLLFSIGAELQLRNYLVNNGMVEAVISLPSGLFDHHNVGISILVLNPQGGLDNIRFVNADQEKFKQPISRIRFKLSNLDELNDEIKHTGNTAFSATVSKHEVLNNNCQLQVGRYVLPESTLNAKKILENAPITKLKHMVKTVRPMLLKSNDAGIEVYEVSGTDFPVFGYINSPGRVVKVDQEILNKSDEQFLKPYDIVIMVKGNAGKVGIIGEAAPAAGENGWVIGQSAIILRSNSDKNEVAKALYMQLRSPLGQELLKGIVSDATIPLIQLRELNELNLLKLDAQRNSEVSAILDCESEMQAQISVIQKQQAELTQHLWTI